MIKRLLPIFTSFLILMPQAFAESRIWTNKGGTTIEAEFIGQTETHVTIVRSTDQKEFEIPIASLSQPDQDWLAEKRVIESGEGIYIAVGNGAHRMSSSDGLTWSNHVFIDKPAHDQNDLKAIAVGNGACVTVGGFSRSNIFTTRDGVEWTKADFNIGVLSGVIFVDDRFVAFGEGGRIAASEDGYEWEKTGDAELRPAFLVPEAEKLGVEPIKSNVRRWRYANGAFVGSGDNSIIVTSTDLTNWNFQRLEPQSRLFIESDGNGFVVRGDRSLHFSQDGIDWAEVTPELPENVKLNSLVHDGERYIVNSRGEEAWESADGKDWTPVDGQTFPGTLACLRPDLYYAFETYWKYTEDLRVSTDGGKYWESATIPEPAGVTNIIFLPAAGP